MGGSFLDDDDDDGCICLRFGLVSFFISSASGLLSFLSLLFFTSFRVILSSFLPVTMIPFLPFLYLHISPSCSFFVSASLKGYILDILHDLARFGV